ncbi:unnamed protein product, partial [Rotaria sp. Silwood2]
IETLKQNLSNEQSNSNALKHAQQSYIERLTTEHEQIIENLKSEYLSMTQEKSEEIDNVHQQLLFQRSEIDSYQDTIENLRKELHEYEKKFLQQNSQLDHLLDEQKQQSQIIIRLKNILGVDTTNHDELLEQFVHKMEQYRLLITESERLNNDLNKQKSEQINIHHELQQLEQQYDDMKDELNKTKQELITNKNKYENQLNELNQSYKQLEKDKHSIDIQFENIQCQFIDKTKQYEQIETKFNKSLNEKDEQISICEENINQQEILNDKLHRELNDLHDELKTKTDEIISLQANLDKIQQTLQSKINDIEQLSQEKISLAENNNQKEKLLFQQKQLTEVHTALEEKFNNLLSEKAGLENQLDSIRLQMQTTETNMNKRKQENMNKLEQAEKKIKELLVRLQNLEIEDLL